MMQKEEKTDVENLEQTNASLPENASINQNVSTENETSKVRTDIPANRRSNLRGRWKRPNRGGPKGQSEVKTSLTEVDEKELSSRPMDSLSERKMRTPHHSKTFNSPQRSDKGHSFQKKHTQPIFNRETGSEKCVELEKSSCCLCGKIKRWIFGLFSKKAVNKPTCSIEERGEEVRSQRLSTSFNRSKRPFNQKGRRPGSHKRPFKPKGER